MRNHHEGGFGLLVGDGLGVFALAIIQRHVKCFREIPLISGCRPCEGARIAIVGVGAQSLPVQAFQGDGRDGARRHVLCHELHAGKGMVEPEGHGAVLG